MKLVRAVILAAIVGVPLMSVAQGDPAADLLRDALEPLVKANDAAGAEAAHRLDHEAPIA